MGRVWGQLGVWAEMIKLPHSVFALPFGLIATFLAGRNLPGGLPGAGQVGLVVLCMVLARSVAMTFNRLADAKLDAANPRTASRAIPTGRISLQAAWVFLGLCAAGFVVACGGFWVLYGNPWPIWLSGPLLVVLCGYSYTKRFTAGAHWLLGLTDGLAPVAAWVAIDPGSLGWTAVVLMGVVTLWVGGFDIIYACQDVEFDRRCGLHSLPVRVGLPAALWIARAAHGGTVVLLVVLAEVADLRGLYLVGVGIVAGLLLVENSLVRADDLSRVNVAFFNVNGVVSVVLGLIVIGQVLLGGGR